MNAYNDYHAYQRSLPKCRLPKSEQQLLDTALDAVTCGFQESNTPSSVPTLSVGLENMRYQIQRVLCKLSFGMILGGLALSISLTDVSPANAYDTNTLVAEKGKAHIGVASFYGAGEKLNSHTANGEWFDAARMACASYDYPFDATLEVTNVANGKSVIVRVNDLGPNRRLGRLIDLTVGAWDKIADRGKGLITVEVKWIR